MLRILSSPQFDTDSNERESENDVQISSSLRYWTQYEMEIYGGEEEINAGAMEHVHGRPSIGEEALRRNFSEVRESENLSRSDL